MTATVKWPRRLAIIGTGLLGASVGMAARAAGVADSGSPAVRITTVNVGTAVWAIG